MEGPSLALRQLKNAAIREWASPDLPIEEIKARAKKGLDLLWNTAVSQEDKLNKLHEDAENSEAQIYSLEEEKQDIIRAAKDALERTEGEIQHLKEKCENLAQELDEVRLGTECLEKRPPPRMPSPVVSSTIADEEKANLWEKLQHNEKKIRSLIFEKTELKDQLKKANSDNKTLASENMEYQSIAEKSGNLKAKLSDAIHRIQALESENADLKFKTQSYSNTCEELKSALEESKSSNEEFQRHIRADRFLNKSSMEDDLGFANSGGLEAELLQTQGLGHSFTEKPARPGTVVNLHHHFHTHIHNHVHKHSHFHRYAEKDGEKEKKEMGIANIAKTQTRPTRLRLVVGDKKLFCSA